MKIFPRYLAYRIKKTLPSTLVFAIIALIIVFSALPQGIRYERLEDNSTSIEMLATILGGLCLLVPMLELSDFKNRRNLDTLFVFPISRFKMALAHYLNGLIQTVAVYSLCFFSAWIYLEIKTDYFALGYMGLYYIFSLLLGIAIYSIFCFLFAEGNNIADGVLFCLLWIFVIYFVGWEIRVEFLKPYIFETQYWESSADFSSDWLIIFSPLNNLTVIFQDIIEVNQHSAHYYNTGAYAARYLRGAYMFFVWGALGIASAVGYFLTFIKKGAEKIGEVSDSWFGYRVLIPAYGYSMLLMFDLDMIMTALVFALMVGGYLIYRRGFKLKAGDIIITGCGVLVLLLGLML